MTLFIVVLSKRQKKEWVCEEHRQAASLQMCTSSLSVGALHSFSLSLAAVGKLLGLFIDGCSMAPACARLIHKWEWDYKGAQEDTVGTHSPRFGLIRRLWIVKLLSGEVFFFFWFSGCTLTMKDVRFLKSHACLIMHRVLSCSAELRERLLCTAHSAWAWFYYHASKFTIHFFVVFVFVLQLIFNK